MKKFKRRIPKYQAGGEAFSAAGARFGNQALATNSSQSFASAGRNFGNQANSVSNDLGNNNKMSMGWTQWGSFGSAIPSGKKYDNDVYNELNKTELEYNQATESIPIIGGFAQGAHNISSLVNPKDEDGISKSDAGAYFGNRFSGLPAWQQSIKNFKNDDLTTGEQVGGLLANLVPGLGGIIQNNLNKRRLEEVKEAAKKAPYYTSEYADKVNSSFKNGGKFYKYKVPLIKYFGKKHKDGGILIDNSMRPNNINPSAEVEGGETSYRNYIFSDHLKLK